MIFFLKMETAAKWFELPNFPGMLKFNLLGRKFFYLQVLQGVPNKQSKVIALSQEDMAWIASFI